MKRILVALLLLRAFVLVFFVSKSGIGLGPDEAQYWTWSQLLDFGYYSKPPGIAWQIWLGTSLLGNTEWGVRLGSLVMGSLLPFAVYGIARASQLTRLAAFWAAVVMAFSPMGVIASLLAITDVGLVLCWACVCWLISRALSKDKPLPFTAIGLFIAVGALFKWLIFVFWIGIVVLMIARREKRIISLFWGFIVSLLGLLPSVIWNMNHEWATFKHVEATIINKSIVEPGTTGLMEGNFLDFLGAQAALLSPIVFIILIFSSIALIRRWQQVPVAVRFQGVWSLCLIIVYLGLAVFKKLQGNWVDYAYPGACVLIAWYAVDYCRRGLRWVVLGVFTSFFLVAVVLMIPFVQSRNVWMKHQVPYRSSPFKHNVGWLTLKKALTHAGYDPTKHFLVSDKYQTTSILSFYGPGQHRAYFLNLNGIRHNQFSYWPGLAQEQRGKTGYFVFVENAPPNSEQVEKSSADYLEKLKVYFRNVKEEHKQTLFYSYGKPVKTAVIFRCEGYNGREEPATNLY